MKKLLTLLLVTTMVLVGCGKNAETAVTEEETYTAVEIETLKNMELHIENIMTAKTYADKDVYVVPKLTMLKNNLSA